MTDAAEQRSKFLALVFTDLADSTALKAQHGDVAGGDLIARISGLVRAAQVLTSRVSAS